MYFRKVQNVSFTTVMIDDPFLGNIQNLLKGSNRDTRARFNNDIPVPLVIAVC